MGGLAAVNPRVWVVLLGVFAVAFALRRLRVWWVLRWRPWSARTRRGLAGLVVASLRARSGRSRP